MPDGWEYKTLSVNVIHGHVQESCDLDTQLSALGSEGWELVAVTPLRSKTRLPASSTTSAVRKSARARWDLHPEGRMKDEKAEG